MTSTDGKASSEYWGADGLEPVARCMACDGQRFKPVHDSLDDLLGDVPGQWGFLGCEACGALHLSPRPAEASVDRAYPASYVTHEYVDEAASGENGSGFVWGLVNGYLNRAFGARREPAIPIGAAVLPLLPVLKRQLDYFFRHLPRRPGRLLDVGCGHGAFLDRARRAGWNVIGIEPDPLAAEAARARGLEVASCPLAEFSVERGFDRITLSHVFEHLHHPRRDLGILRQWLTEGGELWMALPNPRGIGHRLFGRDWFALDPPRHLFLPPAEVVVRMLQDAGFDSIRLLRRGRGSASSILPSMRYRKRRGRAGSVWFARLLSVSIDVLSTVFACASEEIVVIARKGA